MREIQFRAWAEITIKQWVAENGAFKKEYRMLPVHSIHFGTEKVMISSEFGVHSLPFSKVTIMQFTGLHDKNNKEVYEGDIIRGYAGIHAVVTFTDGGFWFVDNANCDGGYRTEQEVREVIGNTYENPELLT